MKNQPHLATLLTKADSKYTVVLVSARRARQLVEKKTPALKGKSSKPVSIALDELVEGKLTYHMSTRMPV